jgi:hypothetical protein
MEVGQLMALIDWLNSNLPGLIEEKSDRFEFAHDSGDHSTIWKRDNPNINQSTLMDFLGDFYADYDGIDLFSSTFKIAAAESQRLRGGVKLISTLQEYKNEFDFLKPKLPEEYITFMIQQGIGFYSIGIKSGIIYEWDIDFNKISGEYQDLYQVFYEWLKAVRGVII